MRDLLLRARLCIVHSASLCSSACVSHELRLALAEEGLFVSNVSQRLAGAAVKQMQPRVGRKNLCL